MLIRSWYQGCSSSQYKVGVVPQWEPMGQLGLKLWEQSFEMILVLKDRTLTCLLFLSSPLLKKEEHMDSPKAPASRLVLHQIRGASPRLAACMEKKLQPVDRHPGPFPSPSGPHSAPRWTVAPQGQDLVLGTG